MNKNGIDIKQFKKFLEKEVGEKCKDYSWDCFVCRGWRIYEELESYIDSLYFLSGDHFGMKEGKKRERNERIEF